MGLVRNLLCVAYVYIYIYIYVYKRGFYLNKRITIIIIEEEDQDAGDRTYIIIILFRRSVVHSRFMMGWGLSDNMNDGSEEDKETGN